MTRSIPWPRILAEGVAIVVSILLAFGIQAWWEGVQERGAEREYITSIRDDLTSDRNRLGTHIAFLEETDREIRRLLHVLDTPDAVVTDTLAFLRLLKRVALAYPFTPASTTFTELSGGGNLALISNRDFLRAVIDYHREAEVASQLDDVALGNMWGDYYEALESVIDPALSADMTADVYRMGTPFDEPLEGPGSSPLIASARGVDLSGLRTDRRYRDAVANNLGSVQVQLGQLRLLLARSLRTLELAEVELGRM